MRPTTSQDDSVTLSRSPSVALYVHVPFCRKRCAYCDFNTYAGLGDLMPAYVGAVCREVETAGRRWAPLKVSTIYLGGGTPSLLSVDLLHDLFGAVHRAFQVSDDCEITVEVNPGTAETPYLQGLRTLGVNRLSLGVQSTHDHDLRMLGRIHTWSDAIETVGAARKAGFENISLDLMFGLPGQTVDRWEETLEAVLELGPEHLSTYGLSVEEGTPLAARIEQGELPVPDEDEAAAMYELTEAMLADKGFFHYEISNWARRRIGGKEEGDLPSAWWPSLRNSVVGARSETISPYVCRHNLVYWRNQPWLGVGAGAHSSIEGKRWVNVKHPQDYVTIWGENSGSRPDDPLAVSQNIEGIDRRLEMGETMMLGLRLAEGVSNGRFELRFGESLSTVFGEELEDLRRLGLLRWDGSVARLTRRGRLLGNRVFARFIE